MGAARARNSASGLAWTTSTTQIRSRERRCRLNEFHAQPDAGDGGEFGIGRQESSQDSSGANNWSGLYIMTSASGFRKGAVYDSVLLTIH